MDRHKDLSLRKPESTSLMRSIGFTKAKVDTFFENYIQVLEKSKFRPENIYNLDETGITTVLKPTKVVSEKGKKQVGQIASAERGELITFVGIINAVGNTIPPVFVFPRVRNLSDYIVEGPTSSIALGSKNGWMTSENFLEVLKHLVNHTKCSQSNRILLLLDNHESRTSVEAIIYSRENGITLLSFPPHTTHRLQPLDVGIYGPFKNKLSIAFNDWLLSNPGKVITIKHIPMLSCFAFMSSFTPQNITSSFRSTGIWPLNRLIFTDKDFKPSDILDRTINPNTEQVTRKNDEQLQKNIQTPEKQIVTEISPEIRSFDPKPSTSKDLTVNGEVITDQNSKNYILEQLRPLPRMVFDKTKKTRKRQSKSTIYTDTPELLAKQALDLERQSKREESVKKSRVKKKVFSKEIDSGSDSESDEWLSEADSDDSIQSLDDFDDEELGKGDFVFVKLRKEKTLNKSDAFCYFIGQILEILGNELKVKFLRRRGITSNFHFPLVEDVSWVARENILHKLPSPSAKGTARTQSLFCFNYNFSSYDLR